jgi:hypothetical protein
MKRRKQIGGVLRLIFFIIILAVILVGIRLAAGKVLSGRTEKKAADQGSFSEVGSTADLAASENTSSVSSLPAGEESADRETISGTGDNLSAEQGATSAAAAAVSEENRPAYDHAATELEIGQAYLADLEQRTPVEMEYMIEEARKEHEKEVQREQYQKKREAYLEQLKGDNLWDAFGDFVFLGDSRVVGFDIFGILPSDRVLAGSGDTINSITDNIDTVKSFSPKYIFLSYGINDIGIGFWPTKEEYAAAFAEKIHTLQKELPNAEIYVNSIIPPQEDAIQSYPEWEALPEYNEAVRQMCEREKIPFINNDTLVQEHRDLYETDGIHLQSAFYRYWAENQLLGIFDRENGLLTF